MSSEEETLLGKITGTVSKKRDTILWTLQLYGES